MFTTNYLHDVFKMCCKNNSKHSCQKKKTITVNFIKKSERKSTYLQCRKRETHIIQTRTQEKGPVVMKYHIYFSVCVLTNCASIFYTTGVLPSFHLLQKAL